MGGGRISSCARPGNFLDFLRASRKFPGNTVILPSPYRKRFPPWAYAKLPYRAWENCSGQCKGLFRAEKRKITMTSKKIEIFVTVYILACHLQSDADPDQAYPFDADPDPDFYLMRMRIHTDSDPDPTIFAIPVV
jgi:hypothetical protein